MSEFASTAATTAGYSNVAGSGGGAPLQAASARVSCLSVQSTARVPTIIAPKAPGVTRAPPNLSDSQPPSGRAMEPTRAPRNAY